MVSKGERRRGAARLALRGRRPVGGTVLLCALAGALGWGCSARRASVPADLTIVWEEEPAIPPEMVEEAQRQLHQRGLYEGAFDGELGAETRLAIVRFQRERGLDITGTLDRETAAALGLEVPGRLELPVLQAPAEAESDLPDAAALLAEGKAAPLPQPPFQALANARAAAASLLEAASERAAAKLGQAKGQLLQERAGREGGRALEEAQAILAAGREEAFQLMVDARRKGGWALLPSSMIASLEDELESRSLLLAPPNGRLDSDDEAAIRWLERSFGLPPTGQPSARLFDRLGLDSTPLFEE